MGERAPPGTPNETRPTHPKNAAPRAFWAPFEARGRPPARGRCVLGSRAPQVTHRALRSTMVGPWRCIFAAPLVRLSYDCARGVVSRSAKWTSRYLGGSSWNRPQRPNPGHLRDCWGCLGRFLGRLGHRTTAIVPARGVGMSLEFWPGAPGDFFSG